MGHSRPLTQRLFFDVPMRRSWIRIDNRIAHAPLFLGAVGVEDERVVARVAARMWLCNCEVEDGEWVDKPKVMLNVIANLVR